MENHQRNNNPTHRHRQIRVIGGGGVVLWGGAMVVAGVVAGFAMKGRFGRRKDSGELKKNKKNENVEGGRLGFSDSIVNAKHTQIDLVSALLGDKPKAKEDSANEIVPHDIVPLINYAIPAPIDIVDPYITVDPDVQEIIPFSKLKPELVADIVQECNKAMPLNESKGTEGMMVEELSREIKGMMADLGRPAGKDGGATVEEVVPVDVAQTAKLARSSTWMRMSVLAMLLLALLVFHFDAMFCVLHK